MVEQAGAQIVYDTGEYTFSGLSRQQPADGRSISFSSDFGPVMLADLPRVDLATLDTALKDMTSRNEPPSEIPSTPGGVPATSPEATALLSLLATVDAIPIVRPGESNPDDILGLIERLADLLAKGILSEQEFAAKKTELLTRL